MNYIQAEQYERIFSKSKYIHMTDFMMLLTLLPFKDNTMETEERLEETSLFFTKPELNDVAWSFWIL